MNYEHMSPAFQSALDTYTSTVRTREGASRLNGNRSHVDELIASVPENEQENLRIAFIDVTVKLIKDIQVYGIDPNTDSEELQHAKRVFFDDVSRDKNTTPGTTEADKDALMRTLDKEDKGKFIKHVMMVGMTAAVEGRLVND